MKTIYFIRHAKSSWDAPISDIDRTLNERGYTDAHHIGEELHKKDIKVDSVYCSVANRAKSTASIIAFKIGIKETEIIESEELYDFDGKKVINFIKKLPAEHKNVLIFGHNPAFTKIVNNFGNVSFDNLPTCGVVAIEFAIEKWEDISAGGQTKFYILPKLLGYR